MTATTGNLPVIHTCQMYSLEFSLSPCTSNMLILHFQQKVKRDQPSQDPAVPFALTF